MITAQAERLQQFVEYALKLKGDEKGEAQVFCDRLFQAFGHGGYKEAGATLKTANAGTVSAPNSSTSFGNPA